MNTPFIRRPRVAILCDREGWAFDFSAKELQKELSEHYDIKIYYIRNNDKLDTKDFDLLHICFWGERYHSRFNISPKKVIKEISSHRWQYDKPYGPISPEEFASTFLKDASFFATPSMRLKHLLDPYLEHLDYIKKGFPPEIFYPSDTPPSGELSIMWAGNAADPVKGVSDILIPAAEGFDLYLAGGDIPREDLGTAYREHDLIVVSSVHEGTPGPLMEGMACGCFPVCCDVGIVPELVRHKENGYIVPERSVDAFREAFAWCDAHKELIRAKRKAISESIQERKWKSCVASYAAVWDKALRKLYYPVFRNDDVAPDTNVKYFKKFCQLFYDRGFTQIHAVTLSGKCNVLHDYGGVATQYEHRPPLSFLKNEEIRRLSSQFVMENNQALIEFLNNSPDELAFHGTAHLDFTMMSEEELYEEFSNGLARMKTLFPNKEVSYFVPPFNRVTPLVEEIAKKFSLITMKPEGIHLEEKLEEIDHFENVPYRYHHHRFYPESKFSYYPLSLELLQKALARPVSFAPIHRAIHRGPHLGHRLARRVRSLIGKVWHTFAPRPEDSIFPLPFREIRAIIDHYGAHPWHKYAFAEFPHRAFTHDLYKRIIEVIPKDAQVLELGCGCGQNLLALAHERFLHLYGVELDENALSVARSISSRSGYKMEFHQGNIFEISFNQKFDLIFSLDVVYLQDVYDLDFFIDKYSKLLVKNGYMAFDVIDSAFNSIPNNGYRTADWHKPVEERANSEYKQRTSYYTVERAAKKNGLQIVFHKFYVETPQRSVYILQKI